MRTSTVTPDQVEAPERAESVESGGLRADLSEPATAIGLRGPGELVAAMPYLFGFEPSESLIVLGLTGPPRERIELAARIDLAELEKPDPPSDELARHLTNADCTTAILVIVSTHGPEHARRVVMPVVADLETVAITVQDLIYVSAGRWRSLTCRDPDCCPPEGRPIGEEGSAVRRTLTAGGHVVFPSRTALADSIARTPNEPGVSTLAAFAQAVRAVATRRETAGEQAHVHAATTMVDVLVKRIENGTAPPTDVLAENELAVLGVMMRDARVGAEMVRRIAGPVPPAMAPLLAELSRRCPSPFAATPAMVLAVYAYVRGDGVLAAVCADRAIEDDPEARLAHLVLDALRTTMPPQELRELVMSGCI